MTQRKVISEQMANFGTYNFEGSLSSVLERVQELIKMHGPNARLDYNERFYYDYDNEPSPRYELYIEREETDKEFMDRRSEERRLNEERDKREKAEFERLAKKYGGK